MGRFVLRDLLRQDADLVVHCLVRCSDGEHGLQRLRAALEEAEIWDEAFAARIHVVAGDIGEARFGLSRSAFDDLARRIDGSATPKRAPRCRCATARCARTVRSRSNGPVP